MSDWIVIWKRIWKTVVYTMCIYNPVSFINAQKSMGEFSMLRHTSVVSCTVVNAVIHYGNQTYFVN